MLTDNTAEPEGVLTYEALMKFGEQVAKQTYDPASDAFVCVGGLDGYFLSFMFITPLRHRIVHPDVHRALEAMTQDEYDERMARAKEQAMAYWRPVVDG